ncbi:UNVERIFIED_CONTAM: transmembrane protein, putative [Hammondia hammondi]|eukprot:XP_008884663.1 transmembrane protein, putative [Hammondia hammondi]
MVPGLILCLVAIIAVPQAALVCIGASDGELEAQQASGQTSPYAVVEDNNGGRASRGVTGGDMQLPMAARQAGLSWTGLGYGLYTALYFSGAWGMRTWGDRSPREATRITASLLSSLLTCMGSIHFALLLHDVYRGEGREQMLKERKEARKKMKRVKKKRGTKKTYGTE